jgi:hypothetical protein
VFQWSDALGLAAVQGGADNTMIHLPGAGVPHHYSMIFPLPLLALGFFMKSLYMEIAAEKTSAVCGNSPEFRSNFSFCCKLA